MTLEIPELRLEVDISREASPAERAEEVEEEQEVPPDSDDIRRMEDESGDLQYPSATSPVEPRVEKPADEEVGEEMSEEDEAMEVDVIGDAEVSADGHEEGSKQEETAVDIEDEEPPGQVEEEPRTPQKRRSRTGSLIAPKRRKRRHSPMSEREELAEEVEVEVAEEHHKIGRAHV